MPQPQAELSASDIRKLLNEKFPATNPREKVYVSVTLALLDSHEIVEAKLKGLAELMGRLLTVLEIDPRQLLAMTAVPKDEDETIGAAGGTGGGAGVGAGGTGGVGGGAGGGGAGPGPVNPIADKTPFPKNASASAPAGTKPRVTVTPPPAAEPVAEDTTPNVQSGPAVNARPNVSPPPANGAPKAS